MIVLMIVIREFEVYPLITQGIICYLKIIQSLISHELFTNIRIDMKWVMNKSNESIALIIMTSNLMWN